MVAIRARLANPQQAGRCPQAQFRRIEHRVGLENARPRNHEAGLAQQAAGGARVLYRQLDFRFLRALATSEWLLRTVALMVIEKILVDGLAAAESFVHAVPES